MSLLNQRFLSITAFVAFIILLPPTPNAAEEPEFKLLGVAAISGEQLDKSNSTGQLSDGTPANLFGGISGLAYSGQGNSFFALSDRGPKDGAVDWHCRFHQIEIGILKTPPASKKTSSSNLAFRLASSNTYDASIVETVLLKDSRHRHFTGMSKAYAGNENTFGRFDPEGIRVRKNGNILISDEYGPHLIEFLTTGEEVKQYPVPNSLLIKNPGIDKATENAANQIGRACNRGMEGIALSPDGKFVFGLMQSPLLQDATPDINGKPIGFHCRIIKMNLESGEHWEYVYTMDQPSFKLHEILFVNENQFFVLENCGGVGEASVCKKVTKIHLEGATDIKNVAQLPFGQLPDNIVAAQKSTVIDLLNPTFGIDRKSMPEKIEGLCFGPTTNGRRTLVVACDNDFEQANPSLFFVFGESQLNP